MQEKDTGDKVLMGKLDREVNVMRKKKRWPLRFRSNLSRRKAR